MFFVCTNKLFFSGSGSGYFENFSSEALSRNAEIDANNTIDLTANKIKQLSRSRARSSKRLKQKRRNQLGFLYCPFGKCRKTFRTINSLKKHLANNH